MARRPTYISWPRPYPSAWGGAWAEGPSPQAKDGPNPEAQGPGARGPGPSPGIWHDAWPYHIDWIIRLGLRPYCLLPGLAPGFPSTKRMVETGTSQDNFSYIL